MVVWIRPSATSWWLQPKQQDCRDRHLGRQAGWPDRSGQDPHPGRGANFTHPKFGPVWSTGHLGDETISLIGTDPVKHKQYAWKEVAKLKGPWWRCAVRQEPPQVQNLWSDAPLNPDPAVSQSIVVYDINNLDKGYKTLPIASGRA